MPKNIVICSDGTGSTAITGRGTNVFKLYEAVDLNGHMTDPSLTPQLAIYDDGVGTEDFKPIKIFAGVTGFGLARNVRNLYKSLARVYDPGDRIFLFGFSRGAFTVRTLAGLIAKCGIPDVAMLPTTDALNRAVHAAYKAYRQEYHTKLARWLHGKPNPKVFERFEKRFVRHRDVRIRFIGVWDTVDAVGTPWHVGDYINFTVHRFKFLDHKLDPSVDLACQALAIDDERQAFYPLLWEEDERVEQVWFAGAHSNVGGGYPKQGMSLVTLDWMIRQAHFKGGLRFLTSDRKLYRDHANVDDKLYDPRAGLGIFYRWAPRDMRGLCRRRAVPPFIHLSVLERIAHGTGDYAPGNIAPNARVVITHSGEPDADGPLLERAKDAERVLHAAFRNRGPLLEDVKTEILIGRVAYYVYLVSFTLVLFAATVPEGAGSRWNPWVVVRSMASLVMALIHLHPGPLAESAERLLSSPELMGFLAGGLLASYAMGLSADRRMSAVFSQFWHDEQLRLRDALKTAREIARR